MSDGVQQSGFQFLALSRDLCLRNGLLRIRPLQSNGNEIYQRLQCRI